MTHRAFLESFEPFVADVALAGERIALGQVVLRFTVPGVPDIYQGDELWDLSLVDPDNRRAVDWGQRRGMLDALRSGAHPTRKNAKLYAIRRVVGAPPPTAAGIFRHLYPTRREPGDNLRIQPR